jgi:hypothetical protein
MKRQTHYDVARNKPNVTLSANPSTLKTIMEIAPRYRVEFRPPNSLRSVLGFKEKVYNGGYNESENIINILTVNSILVEVDIINPLMPKVFFENVNQVSVRLNGRRALMG